MSKADSRLVDMILMELEIRIEALSKFMEKEEENTYFNFAKYSALQSRKFELESIHNFVHYHRGRLRDEDDKPSKA